MTDADPRQRLGELVTERREQLKLSIPKAADKAGIDRETWRSLEAGVRTLRAYNRAAVESALEWEHGSFKQILAGGDPTPIEKEAAARPPHDQYEELILSDPMLTQDQKKALLEDYHLGRAMLERDIRSKIALMKRAGGS